MCYWLYLHYLPEPRSKMRDSGLNSNSGVRFRMHDLNTCLQIFIKNSIMYLFGIRRIYKMIHIAGLPANAE